MVDSVIYREPNGTNRDMAVFELEDGRIAPLQVLASEDGEPLDFTDPVPVQGGAIDGEPLSGQQPVPVGGVYEVTPTYELGSAATLHFTSRARLITAIGDPDSTEYLDLVTSDFADGTSNGNTSNAIVASVRPHYFNGTAWDRARGDTTGAHVVQMPGTSGGLANARVKSAASTNATSVKTSTGQIFGYALHNSTASAKFVKLYNKASAPTVGTDIPVLTIIVPANGSESFSTSLGVTFATGIAYAVTGAIGDTDTTVTAIDDVTGALFYK